MAYGFVIDTSLCYGCKTCTVACAFGHRLPLGVFLRQIQDFTQEVPPHRAFLSMGCNHCDNPSCIGACPVRAYSFDEEYGLVVQDHALCIGCKACIEACPFGAPTYCEEEASVYKCDGCIARAAEGLEPLCVASCPGSALHSGDFTGLLGQFPDAHNVKPEVKTAPNVAVILAPPIVPENLAAGM